MADLAPILEALDDLIERIEQIKTEVANLRAEPTSAAAPRSAPPAEARLPELPNLIPPTRTDDPDYIVGGSRVRPGDFPDCCAVGDEQGYFCSGTLIAPNLVVTARHCKSVSRVFLNGNNVDYPEDGAEIINVKAVQDESGVEQLLSIPHPDVDLRILVLEKKSTVTPRRVAHESNLEGVTEVMLVGFGTIDLAGRIGYGIKRQVKVPVETLDCTDAEIAHRRGCHEEYEIVAGHRGLRRDTCRGDSGGPLYIEAEDGSYLLLGATSRGAWGSDNTCGDGGIYVRVDRFCDWIQEMTGIEV
jgi:secreted trypsin-like serine protease